MSKQLYLRSGSRYSLTNEDNLDIHSQLPAGVYNLEFHSAAGYFFETAKLFEVPSRLYGSLTKQSERIISTYNDRLKAGKSMGVLLNGLKGAGKTLLSKKVSLDLGLPTVLVNRPFGDDTFKQVISNLGPSIVIFDEFEKNYKEQDAQNAILTLFDGVYPSECLFFVICNDRYGLTDALNNRPGRLYYAFEFNTLDSSFIEDYCNDRLHNKEHFLGVKTLSAVFKDFNFDMLQALVEEMNRYKESASEAAKFLNLKASIMKEIERYDVTVTHKGRDVKLLNKTITGHPYTKGQTYIAFALTKAETVEGVVAGVYVSENELVTIDPDTNTYTYQCGAYTVTMKKSDEVTGWHLDGPNAGRRYGYMNQYMEE